MTVDVLRQASHLVARDEPVGLATLVGTRGSTPQKVGARLLARGGQRLAGTLGGGAVEAEAVQEATLAAASGAPGVREYTLSTGVDDWGLACGGTMVVFVERLDGRSRDWLPRVIEASEGRDAVAVVTVLDGESVGGRVLVSGGEVVGTFADPTLTIAAVEAGRRALEAEAAEMVASGAVRLYA